MQAIGRNDPCSCGSGKKYKRCCGASERRTEDDLAAFAARRADAVKALDVRLTNALISFAERRFGREAVAAALNDYFADALPETADGEMAIAMSWTLFSAKLSGDEHSLAELAATNPRDAGVPSDCRQLLRDHLSAWLGIWRVDDATPGVGLQLVDLLTKETRFVHERMASRTLSRFDTALMRVVDSDGISFIGGLFPFALSPTEAESVAKEARRYCRVRTRPVAPELLRDDEIQLAIVEAWRDAVSDRFEPPTLTNTDGDALTPTTDRFDIVGDRREVLAHISSMPGVERSIGDGNDEVFVITSGDGAERTAFAGRTVMGRVVVHDRTVVLETNSAERANRLRRQFDEHLGGLIRFRLRGETPPDALRDLNTLPAAVRSPDDPEFANIARQIREQYMADWMDQPVPALSGLTPRAAATKSRSSRESLDLLLQDFEQFEARLPAPERIDIARLRHELLGR